MGIYSDRNEAKKIFFAMSFEKTGRHFHQY